MNPMYGNDDVNNSETAKMDIIDFLVREWLFFSSKVILFLIFGQITQFGKIPIGNFSWKLAFQSVPFQLKFRG